MIKVFRSRWVLMIVFVIVLASVASLALIFGKGTNAQNNFTCTDSDNGNDYFIKGTARESANPVMDYTDICGGGSSTIPSGHELIEWNCGDDGRVINEYYNCPGGCENGACLAHYDTDGRDYFTKGTTFFKESIHDEESCLSGTRKEPQYRVEEGPYLFEIWIEGGVVYSEAYNCPNGCRDGVCAEESSEEDLELIENQKKIQELITGAKGMTGMLNAINVMQRAFAQLARQGVVMPEELVQTIARVKELGPEMNDFKNRNAENVTDGEAETLADNMNELCEMGLTLEDWGNQVPQFFQIGARMKQASKDLKKAKRDVKLAAKAAARSKFSISDKVDELNEAIEALKVTSDDAIASIDFDEKDWKINEFYDQFQDIYDTIGVINALQNTKKAKAEWGRRIKKNASTISSLERAESDTEELVAKNDEVKAKLDELTPALAQKPMDRDEVKWIFEDLKTLQSEFIDIADQLSGVKSVLPKIKVTKFDTSQFKNFDAFSQFCGISLQNDNGEF